MSRSSYERNWGRQYDRPSLWDRILAFFLRLVPPLRRRSSRFLCRSFDIATTGYGNQVIAADHGNLRLENTNFDLGVVARPGDYRPQDDIYA
jgi:hypothetical protein